MNISFTIKCNPPKSTAQASARILKRKDGTQFIGKFANSKGKRTQNDLMTLLMPHVPEEMITEPLGILVIWTYPWRKSETKKRKAQPWQPCGTRPDADNLMKLLFDCMTRLGYWCDDSLIADVRFIKRWGDHPGISIDIRDI